MRGLRPIKECTNDDSKRAEHRLGLASLPRTEAANMSTTEERQRAAARYMERGMSVIPVLPGEKNPGRSD